MRGRKREINDPTTLDYSFDSGSPRGFLTPHSPRLTADLQSRHSGIGNRLESSICTVQNLAMFIGHIPSRRKEDRLVAVECNASAEYSVQT
jgi:hypothetical protein